MTNNLKLKQAAELGFAKQAAAAGIPAERIAALLKSADIQDLLQKYLPSNTDVNVAKMLNSEYLPTAVGALGGAGVGAIAAPKGSRLRGAVTGAGIGGLAGAAGGYMGQPISANNPTSPGRWDMLQNAQLLGK